MSAVEMKESGIAWLGEIPRHWDTRNFKYVAQLLYGDSLPAEERIEDDVPVYGSNGIVGHHEASNTKSPALVVGRKGSFGKVNYSHTPAFAIDTTYYIDCRSSSEDLRWLYYLLQILELDKSSKDSAVPGLSREDVYALRLPLPPLHEQRAIAAYLDTETARIDKLIAKTERLNDLLREKRTALISRAVTKGLDAGVEMQASGVEWLGEIPGHWDCIPIHAVTSHTNTRDPRHEPDIEFRYIDVSSIHSGTQKITEYDRLAGYDAPTRARNVVFDGDVIFATVRPYLRNIAQIPVELHDSVCSTGYCVLRANRTKLESRFLFYSCIGAGFVSSVVAHQRGVSYPAVSDRVVRRQIIPLPPLHEQRAIASYLDAETGSIDALINKNDRLIALLREKRRALISAAVTGKISVALTPPRPPVSTRRAPPRRIREGSSPSSERRGKPANTSPQCFGGTEGG